MGSGFFGGFQEGQIKQTKNTEKFLWDLTLTNGSRSGKIDPLLFPPKDCSEAWFFLLVSLKTSCMDEQMYHLSNWL